MSAEHGQRIPRFQVQITNAYPELADDLTRVSPRARPERLRALALVGLAVLGGKLLPTFNTPAAAPSEPAADPQLDRRLRLLDAISDHV